MLRLAKLLILLGVLLVFIGAVGFGFLFILSGGDPMGYVRTTYLRLTLASRQEELQRSAGTNSTQQPFTISPGDTPTVIARTLSDNGLILDVNLFLDYLVVEDLDQDLQTGTFFLNSTMTIPEIVNTLIDRSQTAIVFNVVPGMRLEEIAELVDQTPRLPFSGVEFLALVDTGAQIDPALAELLGIPAGASLEGFLYPDSYLLPPDVTALQLRETLLQGFLNAVGEQLFVDAAQENLTMRQAVTLASIIEREAVWDDEHPLIASVYRNRLAINMTLDADPTVQYALDGSRGTWWPNITQDDYRSVIAPHNTYINYGLPPSPIANPSVSAIRAAIHPADTDYLFFRARCDGSSYHTFSENYEEHLTNGCS